MTSQNESMPGDASAGAKLISAAKQRVTKMKAKTTMLVNASLLDEKYRLVHRPTVVDASALREHGQSLVTELLQGRRKRALEPFVYVHRKAAREAFDFPPVDGEACAMDSRVEGEEVVHEVGNLRLLGAVTELGLRDTIVNRVKLDNNGVQESQQISDEAV